MTLKFKQSILNNARLGLVITTRAMYEAVTDLLTTAGYCWYVMDTSGSLVTIYTKG